MTYSFIRDVPITDAQYADVQAALGDAFPEGLVAHLVLRQEHGMRYLDVWETEADWVRFRDERLRPAIAEMMAEHGIVPPASPPPQQPVDVVHAWVA